MQLLNTAVYCCYSQWDWFQGNSGSFPGGTSGVTLLGTFFYRTLTLAKVGRRRRRNSAAKPRNRFYLALFYRYVSNGRDDNFTVLVSFIIPLSKLFKRNSTRYSLYMYNTFMCRTSFFILFYHSILIQSSAGRHRRRCCCCWRNRLYTSVETSSSHTSSSTEPDQNHHRAPTLRHSPWI